VGLLGRIDGIWPRLGVEAVLAAVRGHGPERIRTHWVDLAAPGLACAPTRTPDVAVLLDPDAAVAPTDFLAAGRGAAKTPGLYTWWPTPRVPPT